jgi:type IV pilus assembly protein PilM
LTNWPIGHHGPPAPELRREYTSNMATPKAAWGIEIGAYAIKAIRLEREGDEITVSDFSVIPHKKVLTTPDMDQDEMIRLGLGQFISQKELEGEHLVMSVPGHSAFARFAKLPPVEPKKVPDIVKFEAVQQIPFPIDEVEWDYQTFHSADSPEIEVGIFAITRERVQQRLGLYADVGLSPEAMTLSPVAVYNAMAFDLGKQTEPIVFVDIGTQATDVIISEAGRCWIRTFPLGGTHFTEAVANAFKISYSKAEKLKMEASDSKYAKQIMQAMRPVFSDLLQDLQRSIGYYQSLHRESELKNMVGVGSTFKIPGLRKFLGQQLQIDVVRLDEYKKISVKGREAASFAENAVNMATAYGLALQGVGLAQIDANLVPVKTLRDSMWRGKTKWFAAAAAIMLVGAGMMLFRPMYDQRRADAGQSTLVRDVISRVGNYKQRVETLLASGMGTAGGSDVLAMTEYRRVWPYLVNDSAAALSASNPQPDLVGSSVEKILQIDAKDRRLVQLQKLEGAYLAPAAGSNQRRILVTLDVELSHEKPIEFLNDTVVSWLRQHAEPSGDRASVPYRIIPQSITTNQERLATITVSEEGETVALAQAGSTGNPAAMPGFASAGAPGAAQPAPKPRTTGGESGGMAARTPVAPVAAPGAGFGEQGRGSDGGSVTTSGAPTAAPAMPGMTPVGVPAPGAVPGEDPNLIKDLNATAPAPVKPRLYKPGQLYYRVPVTFEVELIDSTTKPAAPVNATADASTAESNAS